MRTLRCVLAVALCVMLIGVVTPAWAQDVDDGDDPTEVTDEVVDADEGGETGDEEAPPDSGTVVEVNDDGTVTLESGETVRLLGVDVGDAGRAAILFLSGMLVGNAIDIYYDEVIYDDDDVLMGYIYLPSGACVNVEVVNAGYAVAYGQYPCSELEYYWELECQAREQKKGMWTSEERRTQRETEFEGFGTTNTSTPARTNRTLDSAPTGVERNRDVSTPDRSTPDIEPKTRPGRNR